MRQTSSPFANVVVNRGVVGVNVQVLVGKDERFYGLDSGLKLFGVDVGRRRVLEPPVGALLVHEQGLGGMSDVGNLRRR